MRRSASMSAVILSASLLVGCGARVAIDVPGEATSTATSGGLGGAGASSTTASGGLGGAGAGPSTGGAGGAGGGLFELGTFDGPVELALDGEYVYVSVRGTGEDAGQLVKVPKAGGAPIVVAPGLTKTGHLAVDATDVFFVQKPNDKYWFTRVSKTGGKAAVIAKWWETKLLVAHAEHLYGGEPAGGSFLCEFDKLDGGCTQLGDFDALPIFPGAPRSIVVDDTSIYWGASLSLLKMSKSNEVVIPLVDGFVNVQRLAQDATHLYWTTPGSPAALGSVSKDGGEPAWLGEDVEAGTRTLAVYDADVYWTNGIEGTIKRVPKSGGATTVVVSGQAGPGAMVADASGVYWANEKDGRVMRLVP